MQAQQETLQLLQQVQSGQLRPEEALLQLKLAPFEDLGYAKIDSHRPIRQGAAEVIYGAGKTPEEIGALAFPDAPRAEREAEMQKLYEYENELLCHCGGILYPGLPETLAALAQKYALFVVSNSQDGYVQAFLHWSGLTCFRDIEMAGRTGLDKGANIRLVMERNGVTKAVYVGDTQGDADAAAKAGIPFIFTEYGFGSVKDAAARIASLPELPAAVEKIFAEQ